MIILLLHFLLANGNLNLIALVPSIITSRIVGDDTVDVTYTLITATMIVNLHSLICLIIIVLNNYRFRFCWQDNHHKENDDDAI
jgi:hypothetical protein